ncbi:hypothetical protein TrCOL_g3876 [Triparma columacea]|uniref:RNA ligase/cyclic nucleotide phosphodiesterase family protein n=1 Tax=Triparma columacea TaxID=722753 RepID=A0A9W7GKP8_9STRA|nr:hypothetical protein TrCOL_g3876 [Triparma columacea]
MVERLSEVKGGSFSEPFDVSFSSDEIGVFGGPSRGVLWLRPESGGRIEALHADIVKALNLPNLPQRPFVPHLTISHFESRDEAEKARNEIIAAGDEAFPRLTFTCDRLAMLQRNGASGQFFCNQEFLLGGGGANSGEGGGGPWEMPYHYPGMPKEEFDWLPRVRGDLNARRRRNKHKKGK